MKRWIDRSSLASVLVAGTIAGCSCTAPTSHGRDAGTGDAATIDGGAVEIDGALVDASRPDVGPLADVDCHFSDDLDFRTPRVGDCVGRIAERTFRHAVCSCTDVVLNGNGDAVRSYDSRVGPWTPGTSAAGASVAANGTVNLNGDDIVIEGSVTAVESISSNGCTIRGDGITAGGINGGQYGRDCYAAGNVGNATIARNLVQSPSGMLSNTTIGGTRTLCDVTVTPPCPCAADQIIDIASFVTDAATHNDNATAAFDPATLGGHAGASDVTLPPGRLYVPGDISLTIDQHIHVTGPTELYVQGGISMAITCSLDVSADATLDIFVVGSVIINGDDNVLGNATHPAYARIYAASSFVVNGSSNSVYANVYAPTSDPGSNGDGNLQYGARFGHSFSINGVDSALYFDSAVTDASMGCPDEPPTTCTRCSGCDGTSACLGGTMCGACTSDADCCQPLTCMSGRCEPLVVVF